MTARATGRPLQRYIESARPASSAILRTYTTCWDVTDSFHNRVAGLQLDRDF
jgi:hypothetical protein